MFNILNIMYKEMLTSDVVCRLASLKQQGKEDNSKCFSCFYCPWKFVDFMNSHTFPERDDVGWRASQTSLILISSIPCQILDFHVKHWASLSKKGFRWNNGLPCETMGFPIKQWVCLPNFGLPCQTNGYPAIDRMLVVLREAWRSRKSCTVEPYSKKVCSECRKDWRAEAIWKSYWEIGPGWCNQIKAKYHYPMTLSIDGKVGQRLIWEARVGDR